MKASMVLLLFVTFVSQAHADSSIDREAVRRVIKFNLHLIHKCYQSQLSTNPNLEGKVVVEFTVADKGQVQSSKIKTSTLDNAAVENCMMDVIGKAHFPPPSKGTVAVIDYPFIFDRDLAASKRLWK